MYAICYSKRMFFRSLENKHMQNLIQKFYPPALLYYHDNITINIIMIICFTSELINSYLKDVQEIAKYM